MQHQETYRQVAERMTGRYAKGLLSVEWLTARLREIGEQELQKGYNGPDWQQIERRALGLCSQALGEGCVSQDEDVRNLALEQVQRYLHEVLAASSAGATARERGLEMDIVQQTMIEIWQASLNPRTALKQPGAFLKWARVILFRCCKRILQHEQPAGWISLEGQTEAFCEALIDLSEQNPLDRLVQQEESQQLRQAILALKNERYRQVLLATLMEGLHARDLAVRWQVRAQDIALWQCRGLKALRRQQERQVRSA
jgi:DNA-directed RNA polymerase specialized sigma24 family protein